MPYYPPPVAPGGSGDMLKSTYDTNNNGTVDTAEAAPWTGITGKPSTFSPSAHASSHASAGSDPVSLAASQIGSGTLATARLGSGTASASTFLAGNSTWATPPNTLPAKEVFFEANGDVYIVAAEAMTLGAATEAGTGTLSYAKAAAATPTTFNSTTLPVSLAVGDILRVTCASIGTYKAATLPRTA